MALRKTYGDIEEILDEVETRFIAFKTFDFHDFPASAHRFSDTDICRHLFRRSALDRLSDEWKTAPTLLPHGVFLRVCRSRIDAARVAVVAETPSSFHHGLFFFDLRFPRSYPSCPPRVSHDCFGEKQFGQRFHRNGTVPEALLKESCTGKGKEFSAMEVLGYLQRRVLPLVSGNPVFDVSVARSGGERVKVPAGEEKRAAQKSVCEAILGMMRSPPEGFEEYVAGYYRTRSHRILMNMKACVDMEDGEMKGYFFRLLAAFEKNGSYCKHHY